MTCSPLAVRANAAVLQLLDDPLLFQLPAELLQVDVGVQGSPLLQVLHPLEDLVHVSTGHEHEVVEQAHEVLEALQEILERLVPLGVFPAHARRLPSFPRSLAMWSNMAFSMSR